MKRDNIIFDIIEKEHQRQLKGIELIASENFVSDQVMQAMGSCLTNKYAEGYPGKRYYGFHFSIFEPLETAELLLSINNQWFIIQIKNKKQTLFQGKNPALSRILAF